MLSEEFNQKKSPKARTVARILSQNNTLHIKSILRAKSTCCPPQSHNRLETRRFNYGNVPASSLVRTNEPPRRGKRLTHPHHLNRMLSQEYCTGGGRLSPRDEPRQTGRKMIRRTEYFFNNFCISIKTFYICIYQHISTLWNKTR